MCFWAQARNRTEIAPEIGPLIGPKERKGFLGSGLISLCLDRDTFGTNHRRFVFFCYFGPEPQNQVFARSKARTNTTKNGPKFVLHEGKFGAHFRGSFSRVQTAYPQKKAKGKRTKSQVFSGCFQGLFQVFQDVVSMPSGFSGYFQGVFSCALSGYALWTLPGHATNTRL